MDSSEGVLQVGRQYMDALSRGDFDTLRGLVKQDLQHDFSRLGIELEDPHGEAISRWGDAGQPEIEIHDMFASGDKVAARYSFTVNPDAVPGAESSRPARVTGLAIVRIEDGKIVDAYHEIDALGLLLQLGVTSLQPTG